MTNEDGKKKSKPRPSRPAKGKGDTPTKKKSEGGTQQKATPKKKSENEAAGEDVKNREEHEEEDENEIGVESGDRSGTVNDTGADGEGHPGRVAADTHAGEKERDPDAEDEDGDRVDLGADEHHDAEYERERMRQLLASLTTDQLRRYECYRRSQLPRATVRRLMQSTGPSQVSATMAIVVAGVAKVFVGEMVEKGRVVMEEAGETGPLRRRHLREAYRRLKKQGAVPLARAVPSTLFRR